MVLTSINITILELLQCYYCDKCIIINSVDSVSSDNLDSSMNNFVFKNAPSKVYKSRHVYTIKKD